MTKPMISNIGPHPYSRVSQALGVSALAWITTSRSISLLARPSYWIGA